MSSFSDYLEAAVLNHVFRNTALSSPATLYAALFTTAPTDAGGGTEVSGAGYARQTVAFDAPSGGQIANSGAVAFAASGGDFGTVVAIGIFDAESGGNLLAWDDFSGVAVTDGNQMNFAAGAITVSLD